MCVTELTGPAWSFGVPPPEAIPVGRLECEWPFRYRGTCGGTFSFLFFKTKFMQDKISEQMTFTRFLSAIRLNTSLRNVLLHLNGCIIAVSPPDCGKTIFKADMVSELGDSDVFTYEFGSSKTRIRQSHSGRLSSWNFVHCITTELYPTRRAHQSNR